jgi:hypothetical protein
VAVEVEVEGGAAVVAGAAEVGGTTGVSVVRARSLPFSDIGGRSGELKSDRARDEVCGSKELRGSFGGNEAKAAAVEETDGAASGCRIEPAGVGAADFKRA